MRRRAGCLVFLLVLAGLAVGADFAARSYAEHLAEQRLRQSGQISGPARVSIHGFPFLVQVARRKLDRVDVDGAEIRTSQLQLTRLHAVLRGLRPDPGLRSAHADVVNGTAFVSFADLERAGGRREVTLADGGKGQVRVTGKIVLPVLGRSVTASALSRISAVDGNALLIQATQVQVPGVPIDPTLTRLVGARLDFRVPLQGLPQGLRLVDVRVSPGGLTADLQGQQVPLGTG